jgi:hypothetical protein
MPASRRRAVTILCLCRRARAALLMYGILSPPEYAAQED